MSIKNGTLTVGPNGETYVYFMGTWGAIEVNGTPTNSQTIEFNDIPEHLRPNLQITTKDNANVEGASLIDILGSGFVQPHDNNLYNGVEIPKEFIEVAIKTQPKIVEETVKTTVEEVKVTPADLRKKRLARYGKKRQGGVLRYPLESMTQHTDYLQIDIEKYEAIGSNYITSTGSDDRYVIGNARQNRAGRVSSSKLAKKPLINAGTIILPIPSNLQDTNNVNYGESSLNGLAAVGVSAVEEGMVGLGNFIGSGGADKIDFASFTGNIKNRLEAGLGAGDRETALVTASDIVVKKLVSEAVSIFGGNVTTNQLISRESGEILNPNMELLFNDVTIRNFRFSFKFTPRNPKEAEQVKLIIRAFKRNMAPQAQGGISGAGNFFLRAPNVFKLRYRSGNKDHPFLNKFKQCFLTDAQTTYTGEGVHTTYDDGTPVSIILDLSFKEIQPIYDLDYDKTPGTGAVGY